MAFRVLASYVTAKVPQQPSGLMQVLGFYKDALIPGDVDAEDRDRLLAKGMIEEIVESKPEKPKAEPDTAPTEPTDKEPAKATKAAATKTGGG